MNPIFTHIIAGGEPCQGSISPLFPEPCGGGGWSPGRTYMYSIFMKPILYMYPTIPYMDGLGNLSSTLKDHLTPSQETSCFHRQGGVTLAHRLYHQRGNSMAGRTPLFFYNLLAVLSILISTQGVYPKTNGQRHSTNSMQFDARGRESLPGGLQS